MPATIPKPTEAGPGDPAHSYSTAQKTLHWLVALVIAGLLPVGLTMTSLDPSPLVGALYEMHKSFGLIVFGLVALRIALRFVRGAPPPVPGLPAWQRAAARGSHLALYILIVAVPLGGWIATSACCAPVRLFWTIPVTLPLDVGEETAKTIFKVHGALALTLAAIVAVHAAAALHHHLVRRDGTLRRMLASR